MSLRILLAVLAGWLDRRQQDAVAYLIEENRILRGLVRGQIRFTDEERRRPAVHGHRLGRRRLRDFTARTLAVLLLVLQRFELPPNHRLAALVVAEFFADLPTIRKQQRRIISREGGQPSTNLAEQSIRFRQFGRCEVSIWQASPADGIGTSQPRLQWAHVRRRSVLLAEREAAAAATARQVDCELLDHGDHGSEVRLLEDLAWFYGHICATCDLAQAEAQQIQAEYLREGAVLVVSHE
jgi:hypothetical protein